jgi:hypothetical protein
VHADKEPTVDGVETVWLNSGLNHGAFMRLSFLVCILISNSQVM